MLRWIPGAEHGVAHGPALRTCREMARAGVCRRCAAARVRLRLGQLTWYILRSPAAFGPAQHRLGPRHLLGAPRPSPGGRRDRTRRATRGALCGKTKSQPDRRVPTDTAAHHLGIVAGLRAGMFTRADLTCSAQAQHFVTYPPRREPGDVVTSPPPPRPPWERGRDSGRSHVHGAQLSHRLLQDQPV